MDEDSTELLQVAYQWRKDVGWTVGYLNGENFFRWKGTTIPRQHITLRGGPGLILDDNYQVIETLIDPPVDYIQTASGYAEPGYFDPSLHHFYRWKDVRFDPWQVPAAALGRPRNPKGRFSFAVIDIEVPDHRRPFAAFLNRTRQPR